MYLQKKINPSHHFSLSILMIGTLSLASALLFAHTREKIQLAANASTPTCHSDLEGCMKKTAESQADCQACAQASGNDNTTASCQACAAAKAECQNTYNQCTDQGGKIHTW